MDRVSYHSPELGGYRRNANPPIHIDPLPFHVRWKIKEMFGKMLVVLFVMTFALSIVLGGAAAIQWLVTGFAGHPIGQYPHYCVALLVFLVFFRARNSRSE